MNDHLPSLQRQHEQFLEQLLRETVLPAPKLQQAIAYSLFSGGKRFRPLLVYLSGEIVGLSMPVRDILAAAVEMIHTYSLIHDDLPAIDNDDFRRSRPACHRAFDEATAILAGDALASWAVDLLVERTPSYIGADKSLAVSKVLLNASGPLGMISGQSLDMSVLLQATCTKTNLETIHQLKTGALIRSCIEMVLIAAEQYDRETGVQLRRYAEILGLLFQMQDDYLDRYASTVDTGKIRASDTANAKYTYVDFCSQAELHQQIENGFTSAIDCLARCGPQAEPLTRLTRQLQSRSSPAP